MHSPSPSQGSIDMQTRKVGGGLAPSREPLCTNSLFVIPSEGSTPAQKWAASIEMTCPFFPPRDTDGEVLVFSTHLEPAAHRGLPYVFAKALSQSHWLSIQSIEPQCLLFICCLESLTGYTDKTLIKTSSVTSCDIKAAWVLEPSVTSWRSPCLWGCVCLSVRVCLCMRWGWAQERKRDRIFPEIY